MALTVRTMARAFNINASSGKLLYFFLEVKAMTQIHELLVTCIPHPLVEQYEVSPAQRNSITFIHMAVLRLHYVYSFMYIDLHV
jgi:hypothetical protein